MAILPEELMVLALHEETGQLLSRQTTDFGVAAAELVALTLAGRVTPDEKGRRVVVQDPRPTGDPDLDAVLSWLGAGRPKDLRHWLANRGAQARRRYLDRLVAAQVLRREEHRALGLFPAPRYPLVNPQVKGALRWRLDAVVAAGPPDVQTAALAALFGATRLDRLYYPGRPGRAARARFAEMARSEWAGVAVGQAIAAMNAAVSAAILASTAASSATM